ncbi:MAG: hypothetical protein ACM3QU_09485 [Verrucomicrobiota bacterium]
MTQLTFFGWWQPPGAAAVTSPTTTAGRLTAALQLTASDIDHPSDSATRTLAYDLLGPGDVTGLSPGAVVHTYPSPGAQNIEIDKAVYAELAAPDLPWRHTLDLPQGKALRPWIVLLVGTVDEIEVAGGTVRLQPSVLDAHPPSDSARGAHVEQDPTGRSIARLISSRALEPDRDHVAVIVPAYTAAGAPAWATPAGGAVELAAYHHWIFHTRAGGDFAALARRLKLREAGPEIGSSEVDYAPLPTAPALRVRGALVSTRAPQPEALPPDVAADVSALTAPLGDAAHPVLGLPDHAGPWPPAPPAPPPPGWRDELHADYRSRAVAGIGTEAAVVNQELLSREAGLLAGAYEEVADRLRRLSLGLLASRSLWRRRVPTNSVRRLGILGPALRTVLTADGPVMQKMEHADRALEGSLFSSAAQRALRRRGSEPAAAASAGFATALRRAAAAPPRPVRSAPQSLHTDAFARQSGRAALDEALAEPAPSTRALATTARRLRTAFDRTGIDRDTVNFLDTRLGTVDARLDAARPVAILPLLGLLDSGRARPSPERLRALGDALSVEPDSDDLVALGALVSKVPPQPVATAYDLAGAANQITPAFDPTVARPSIVDRVLAGVEDAAGLVDAEPTTPVELTPDLDLPAWRFLRDNAPEWLLPGAGTLEPDSVVALTTNPAFVDAFLLGLNAQLVAELRFRNYPLIPAWTPVRTFWDRANAATGSVEDDIVDIATWPPASAFGAATHQTPSASSADLVVLFNSPLFREYPGTLVYLVAAARDATGKLDWAKRPSFDSPQFPAFQGRISPDQTFFGFDLDPNLGAERWVVLEETVNGRRFFNAAARPSSAHNGADLAVQTVSAPRRVLIRGDVLLGGGQT